MLDPQEVEGEDFPGETFGILKKNEMWCYDEYRIKRLVPSLREPAELKGSR